MRDINNSNNFDETGFPFGFPMYNTSVFFGFNEFSGVNSLYENRENGSGTQLILSNGTRTKVPKGLFSMGKPTISAFVIKLSFYTCPVIVAVGLLSNILAYMVFTKTRLRRVPSVPYLAAMAVVDSGALLTEFLQHGIFSSWDICHKLGKQIDNTELSGVCQYTTYFNFVFIFLCIWYPVALCVEKFISVYFPLRKTALCTTFRAKVVVISIAVMTGTCYYYVIYMTGPVGKTHLVCAVWDVFIRDFHYLMKLDGFFVIVLPNTILIILMVLICGRGCEYYRISSAVEVSRTGSARNSSLLAPVRVTNVIFPVVCIVLVLKLPIGLMRLYWTMVGSFMTSTLVELQGIFIYAGRLEWIIKFYIYLVFSPSFRRRTKSFLCGMRSKLKYRCRHDSMDDDEIEGIAVAIRINLPERVDRDNNPRACLMVSDV